ncbi:hypothetical protein GH868_30880, partial [Bacillus thuringiensis]|nr:hypothetical protein [Bacillus thuringiensis]
WDYEGAHTFGYNRKAVAISAIGNFEIYRPDGSIVQAIANLIDCAVKQRVLDPNFKIYGHLQVKKTACPGRHLYDYVKA